MYSGIGGSPIAEIVVLGFGVHPTWLDVDVFTMVLRDLVLPKRSNRFDDFFGTRKSGGVATSAPAVFSNCASTS